MATIQEGRRLGGKERDREKERGEKKDYTVATYVLYVL